MIIEARDLSFSYDSGAVLEHVNLRLEPGITALVGPNAAGKSTLLKCLAGLLEPAGRVHVDGQPLSGRELSRCASFLPQEVSAGAALTVFETVLLGRLHNLSWRAGSDDLAAVESMLGDLGIAGLAGRRIDELSGGQLQLVYVAQALVKSPSVLIMDEPTSSLDLRHQLEMLELVSRLTKARGLTTVAALHDLGMAACFADRMCVLHSGRIWREGAPREVLTPEMLALVYGVRARVIYADNGNPYVIPEGVV